MKQGDGCLRRLEFYPRRLASYPISARTCSSDGCQGDEAPCSKRKQAGKCYISDWLVDQHLCCLHMKLSLLVAYQASNPNVLPSNAAPQGPPRKPSASRKKRSTARRYCNLQMASQHVEFKAQVDSSPILSFLTRYTDNRHDTLDAVYARNPFTVAVVFRYLFPCTLSFVEHCRLWRSTLCKGCFLSRGRFHLESSARGTLPRPSSTCTNVNTDVCFSDFNKALWLLKHMSILKGKGSQAWLDSTFQRQLHQILSDDNNGFKRIGVLDESGKGKVDAHAKRIWGRMLYLLVSPEIVSAEDKLIIDLLTAAGLMEQCKEGRMASERSITSEGFQFLLKDVYRQAWILLEQYVLKYPGHLERVLRLSLHPLGVFRASADAKEAEFLLHMHSLGLVYRFDDECYSVSPMSTSLTTDPSLHSCTTRNSAQSLINVNRTGFIVVETNYRLYAYTSLPLQSAILALFVHLRGHFPNLLYGVITRDSCRAAFSRGITADQVQRPRYFYLLA